MKSLKNLFTIYIISLFVSGCIKFGGYIGSDFPGISMKVPIWSTNVSNKDTLDYDYNKFSSAFDTTITMLLGCQENNQKFFAFVKTKLEKEGYTIMIYRQNENLLIADKEHHFELNKKAYLNIRINIEPNLFEHSKYSTVKLIYRASFSNLNTKELIITYYAEFINVLRDFCIKANVAEFGFAHEDIRKPITKDEIIIYEKFGEAGLRAIDAINGVNTLEEIMEISGMNVKEFLKLIKYLKDNKFIEW